MKEYDLKDYAEQDHELVETVSTMEDDESIVLEMQDLNGEPLLEEDGSPVHVSLNASEMHQFLELMKEKSLTFNDVIVEALEKAAEFENIH